MLSRYAKQNTGNILMSRQPILQHPWLQLVRVPNLLTVPGDPLAGFLLACGGKANAPFVTALLCAAASLMLYAAGVVCNDCFDLEEDRRKRPERPLPSGLINPGVAIAVAVILVLLSLMAACIVGTEALTIAVLMVVAITLYNVGTKRKPGVGAINMGICRGLSLTLGAATTGWSGVFSGGVVLAASGLSLYVAAVTGIAARETEKIRICGKRWLPLAAVAVCFTLFFLYHNALENPAGILLSAIFASIALAWIWQCGARLSGKPEPATVSRSVGQFLGALLPVQATFSAVFASHGIGVAVLLLIVWPVFSILTRRFYAS